MAEGEVKKFFIAGHHKELSSLENLAWKQIQFHLPSTKCRQYSEEITKDIYSSRKLKAAAGGWKAAGRREGQECLVGCHCKGKSAQSRGAGWFSCNCLWFRMLLATERNAAWSPQTLCFLSQMGRTRKISCATFFLWFPCYQLSVSCLLPVCCFQGQAKHLGVLFVPLPLLSERHRFSLPDV